MIEPQALEDSSSSSLFSKKKDEKQNGDTCETTMPVRRGKNKSVKFSADIQYRYFDMAIVKKSNVNDIWYSEDELWIISEKNKKVARRFFKGKLIEGADKKHTYRGLEDFDKETFVVRMTVILHSIEAVLVEQVKQKHAGIVDPVALADVYRCSGATACQQEAAAWGKIDHKTSIQCISSNNEISDPCDEDDPMLSDYFSSSDTLKVKRYSSHVVQPKVAEKKRRNSVSKAGKRIKKLLVKPVFYWDGIPRS